jgi:hypothetical protein
MFFRTFMRPFQLLAFAGLSAPVDEFGGGFKKTPLFKPSAIVQITVSSRVCVPN